MYNPCFECHNRYGHSYTEECDEICDYAKVCLKNKKYPCSDLTFSYKLESARFNPDSVLECKWQEYFIEVFDMLHKYELVITDECDNTCEYAVDAKFISELQKEIQTLQDKVDDLEMEIECYNDY